MYLHKKYQFKTVLVYVIVQKEVLKSNVNITKIEVSVFFTFAVRVFLNKLNLL